MSDGRGSFGVLLLGVIIGAALAILYAPDKGERTRKRLAKRSESWREAAGDALESAGEMVEKSRKRFGV